MLGVGAILFTVGMLLRVVWIYVLNSSRFTVKEKGRYIGRTASALVTSILAVFVGLGGEAESIEGSLLLMPLVFCGIIAFLYRDLLVPIVTEGVVFLYSLIALYVFISSADLTSAPGFLDLLTATFLLVSAVSMFVLCITEKELSLGEQVTIMVMFFLISAYIMFQSVWILIGSGVSPMGQILGGFYSLHFLVYILYVLYLVPIRFNNIKRKGLYRDVVARAEHVAVLSDKYIEVNMNTLSTLLVIVLAGSLFVIDGFFADKITPILIIMIIGAGLTQTSEAHKIDENIDK